MVKLTSHGELNKIHNSPVGNIGLVFAAFLMTLLNPEMYEVREMCWAFSHGILELIIIPLR